MTLSQSDVKVRDNEIKREVSNLYVHAVAGLDNGSTQAGILVRSRDKIFAILDAPEAVGECGIGETTLKEHTHAVGEFLKEMAETMGVETADPVTVKDMTAALLKAARDNREWMAAHQGRQPAQPPVDFVMVPQSALNWLDGSGPDAEGKWFSDIVSEEEKRVTKYRRAYWWRSHFRKLIGKSLAYNKESRTIEVAAAPQQPEPSGDARELAKEATGKLVMAILLNYSIKNELPKSEDIEGMSGWILPLVESFATATREKALEEAAQLCDDHKLREEEQDFWVKNMPQMLASEIRALAKRGG